MQKKSRYKKDLSFQESILPNFDIFVFPIFACKLGYLKVQTILSYATNTQA